MELKDAIALVTGGGEGIGRGISEALKAEGSNVTITGRREDALRAAAEEMGVDFIAGDVGREADAVRTMAAVIEKHGRLDILAVPVERQVAQRRHPCAVRRLVLAHQNEGLAGLCVLLQPIDREVGHDVGAVAFDRALAVGAEQDRVVVVTLSAQHLPVVEALWVRSQVPLAENRGGVARLLQQFRKRLLRAVELVAVLPKAVQVAV